MFGEGPDLCAFENGQGYSHLGYSYELPPGLTKNTWETDSYLAGSRQFKLKELEVYQVIFKQ